MTQSTYESIQELLPIFSTIFSRDVLKDLLKELDIRMYWRAYSPLIVLWGFLYQRLQSDHTCDNYVAYLQSGKGDSLDPADAHKLPLSQRLLSESNAGYVQGRNRLPLAVLQVAMQLVYRQIQNWIGDQCTWQGHAVRFIDGTTYTLYPLGDLAETYGHSSNQNGEHYWVKVRSVASFDLVSQAAVAMVEAPYSTGETSLVLPLLQEDPEPGALYVGDCNFGVYRVLQAVHAASKEGLFRLQEQQWKSLLRRNGIDRIEPGESYPCMWQPSRKDTLLDGVPAPVIAGRLLYVRLEKKGFRPLNLFMFTTLLDEERYPVSDLASLYGRRYGAAEVDFRHLKVGLQLENLSVRSAEMFRKELAACYLAYNLVRALMTYAAMMGKQDVSSLSFAKAKRRLYRILFEGHPTWINNAAMLVQHICRRMNDCRLPSQRHKARHEPRRMRYKGRRYPPLTTDRQTARHMHLKHLQEATIS